MIKRVIFRAKLLPYLLVAPQIAITLIFFIWPAAQAVKQSVFIEGPFGGNAQFVWLENFTALFSDPNYLHSARVTVVFSTAVTFLRLPISLLLAGMAPPGRSGPGRRFWTIILPLLSPTAFFLLVVNVVHAFFQTFGIIHAVTQGGPAKATEILVFKVYNDGFRGLDLGGSAAQSVVLMAIVIGLTVIQFRYIERKVHY